jgi:hypothetical protein
MITDEQQRHKESWERIRQGWVAECDKLGREGVQKTLAMGQLDNTRADFYQDWLVTKDREHEELLGTQERRGTWRFWTIILIAALGLLASILSILLPMLML